MKKKTKKKGILKRLKNIERNQKSNNNNNNRNNLSSAKIESSSARSESSTKTLFNDGETQTSFKYLKDNTEEFFLGYSDIFDSDLKEFFNYIAYEEKNNIDYKLLSTQILIMFKNSFSFSKYGDLYNFWFNLLFNNINLNNIKLQQINVLKDLMNGFKVYEKIKKPKNN